MLTLRERQKRNILTTLFLSQGVPMLLHGDELGRTQEGNNNVYCQDNPISWVDWADARENWALTDFVARLASCARTTRSSAAAASSRATRRAAPRASSATSPGSPRPAST